ncbi:hypothetical protein BH23CHL4_BH23CHL4_29850 [soil metagenome]
MNDTGITRQDIQGIADQIQPGQVALIALVPNHSVIVTQSALEGFDEDLMVQLTSEKPMKEVFEVDAPNKTLTDEPPGAKPVPDSAGETLID